MALAVAEGGTGTRPRCSARPRRAPDDEAGDVGRRRGRLDPDGGVLLRRSPEPGRAARGDIRPRRPRPPEGRSPGAGRAATSGGRGSYAWAPPVESARAAGRGDPNRLPAAPNAPLEHRVPDGDRARRERLGARQRVRSRSSCGRYVRPAPRLGGLRPTLVLAPETAVSHPTLRSSAAPGIRNRVSASAVAEESVRRLERHRNRDLVGTKYLVAMCDLRWGEGEREQSGSPPTID